MAAAVASLPIPTSNDAPRVDNPAEARKRRREILASQRNSVATPDASISAVVVSSGETSPETKKRKVLTTVGELPAVVSPPTPVRKAIVSKTTGKPKKPQMKYNPDVPMTKEEAAAWRREQRRKRNRESAAASRQRQRDRIVELEAEVEEWKAKFDQAMKRIQELEQAAGSEAVPQESSEAVDDVPEVPMEEETIHIQSPEELVEEVFKDTTILISPSHSPRSVSPTSSTTVDFSQVQAVKVVSNVSASSTVSSHEEQTEEEPQPPKMISRQA